MFRNPFEGDRERDQFEPPQQTQPPQNNNQPPPPPQNSARPPQMGREEWRDTYMRETAGMNSADVGNWLSQHGGTNYDPRSGRFTTPHGEVIDGVYDADGNARGGMWTGVGGGGGGTDPRPGSPESRAAANGGVDPITGFSISSSSSRSGVSGELYDMLMSRAKQGTQIDRNDPNIRQQVDPYTAQVERQRRDYLADVAERGGPLANINSERRLSAERAGQASGLFEAQLIGRELDSRRQEIMHALDSLGGRLSEDQRIALQRELGHLNDATQRYGIDKGAETAWGQIGLGRDQLGLGYQEFDWLRDPSNPRNIPGFNN